jgi:hypothetical protein
LEPGRHRSRCETADKALQKVEVHPTDETGVLLGQFVKGAVPQRDLALFDARFVTDLDEELHERVGGTAIVLRGTLGNLGPRVLSQTRQHGIDRFARVRRLLDGCRQKVADERIPTLRE